MGGLERLALGGWQGFGQPAEVEQPQQHAHNGQEPENAVPAQVHQQPAAHHGRYGRRHPEIDGDLAHHLLRLGRRKQVADHRPRHHHARPGRHALQRAEKHQLRDVLRQCAPGRGHGEQGNAPQHHSPAAKAVGQRTMEQVHEGEAEQVGRQGLLHLHRGGAQRPGDAGKRRDVGVDRERPQHAQHRQQCRQGPARAAPEWRGFRLHGLLYPGRFEAPGAPGATPVRGSGRSWLAG